MDIISLVISALLFAAFVPGVLITLPGKASRGTILVTHAVLFSITASVVMWFYWTQIRERFGNYGPTCPNGYVPGVSQSGAPDCVPSGHATYAVDTGSRKTPVQ